MARRNKIDEVSFTGGFIGLFAGNPRSRIDARVQEANKHGWTLVQVLPSMNGNILTTLLQVLLLIVTLGLFTFGTGVFLVFEKEAEDAA